MVIPAEFYQGETRCDYYVSPDMKKVWAVLLDLLVEFMRVCDHHHIKYYMCGGSILGAVRHGGFIPWDDDIDVMMMREEYEKLIEIGPNEFKHPYFFQIETTDPGSAKGHIQIRNSETACLSEGYKYKKLLVNQGIFLDVFPIDRVPERFRESFPYISNLVKLRNDIYFYKRMTIFYRFKWRKNLLALLKDYITHIMLSYHGNKDLYRIKYNQFLLECQKYNNKKDVRGLMLTPFPVENGIWKDCDYRA